jgi:tetraacyldisaccharide 4'-kinase
LIYAIAILCRKIFYRLHIFKTHRAPLKVISVGNVTLGGTGKTPFTIVLAKILESSLKKNVCILIRGYGWDEQELLKRGLDDVPVLVGQDRRRSSCRAVRLYASDTAILDDGFQHWELARDLDIVLIDSRSPFGNGFPFPRGILRESKRALSRADIIVFTKMDKKRSDINKIKKEIDGLKKGVIFLEAVHAPKYFYEGRARRRYDLSHVKGKRVILLSSIGDPLYFEEIVKNLCADVIEHVIFMDHHNYKKPDIERLISRCGERNFDFLLTTEKDIVKLNRLSLGFSPYTVLTLAIEMEITRGKEALIDRLHSLYIS